MKDYALNQIRIREAKIKELRGQIARFEQQVMVLEAEARTYREMINVMPDETSQTRRKRSSGTGSRAQRGLSEIWRKVIAHVAAQYPEDVGLDAIYLVIRNAGNPMKEDSIRSQIASQVNRGYMTRTTPGRFRASPDQAKKAGVSQSELDAAKQGSSNETPDARAPGASEQGDGTGNPSSIEHRDAPRTDIFD